jgi:maleylpyruvate isomerase
MRVYEYFRSSAAYRLRIALNLKKLSPERVFVHLRKGNQRAEEYLAKNPQGLVPALELDDGTVLTQSLAIIEYLDERYPEPPLLPRDPLERACVRSFALQIACDIHPLDNLRVLTYLLNTMGVSKEQKDGWYKYWIDVGFEALETELARSRSNARYCFGDAPTLADVCLVPQMANARRMNVDLAPYPTLVRIEGALNELPAFAAALPERQPDAE